MSLFQYSPFEKIFEEKFSEDFPQVKELFEQRPDDRKYPFKFDPVVSGRKNVGIKADDEIEREKDAEKSHLQTLTDKMRKGSRVLSKLTGVKYEDDLSRRKKCCCPDDAIIQRQGWTSGYPWAFGHVGGRAGGVDALGKGPQGRGDTQAGTGLALRGGAGWDRS